MRVRPGFLAILALGGCFIPPLARAADPSKQAPIAGQDVMGDKSRSGPDGWSWAPITRNQAASGRAPGQTEANIKAAPDARTASGEGKTLPAGQDPGAPAATAPNGPGTLDASSSKQKP
jgi:hypothetical protein